MVTSSLRRRDGRAVHQRKSTVAEPALMTLYRASGLSAALGGTCELVSQARKNTHPRTTKHASSLTP